MKQLKKILWEGFIVTAVALGFLAMAFALYFLLFMALESTGLDGSYAFVPWLRVGFGLTWLIFCRIVYQTNAANWLKAGFLSAAFTTFFASIGVQFFEEPLTVVLIALVLSGGTIYLFYRAGVRWFYYYAVFLALINALLYR